MALVSTNVRFGEFQTDDGALEAFEKVASVLSGVTSLLSAKHAAVFIARMRALSVSASADGQVEIKLSIAAAGSFEPSYSLSVT